MTDEYHQLSGIAVLNQTYDTAIFFFVANPIIVIAE